MRGNTQINLDGVRNAFVPNSGTSRLPMYGNIPTHPPLDPVEIDKLREKDREYVNVLGNLAMAREGVFCKEKFDGNYAELSAEHASFEFAYQRAQESKHATRFIDGVENLMDVLDQQVKTGMLTDKDYQRHMDNLATALDGNADVVTRADLLSEFPGYFGSIEVLTGLRPFDYAYMESINHARSMNLDRLRSCGYTVLQSSGISYRAEYVPSGDGQPLPGIYSKYKDADVESPNGVSMEMISRIDDACVGENMTPDSMKIAQYLRIAS